MFKTSIFISLAVVQFVFFVDCASVQTGKSYLEPYLNKKYELFSSDNFDAVMEALDVGIFKRKMGNLAKPVMELTEEDGVYTLSSKTFFKDFSLRFRIGEEFDEITPDEREVRSVVTQDRNVLTHVQKGDKEVVTIREFTPDEVKVTVKVDDVVSVRVYKAL